MAVASMKNFTVPLATNQSTTTQGLLMPKLQYRFRVTFEGFGSAGSDTLELTKQVVSFARPTVNFADVDIHVYNSVVKLAGKHTWNDVSTTIRDDAAGNVSKLVGYQLQKQFDFMQQSSAVSGGDYKFITRCEILDGGNGTLQPQVLETWVLYGCYIKEANYQELNYSGNDPVTIQLSLRYDNAMQLPIGAGLGTTLARAVTKGIATI